MKTHDAKRVAVIIESVMQSRLTEALEKSGVTGYTILPVLGGSGRSGPWTRDGEVTRGSGMVQIVCIISPDKLDRLLNDTFKVVKKHIGVITVSDCQVLRAERF